MTENEVEIDAVLVLAKRIKLRTVEGVIMATELQVYESEDPYVLIFLFTTELQDELRLDVFKEDLSREFKYWLDGKYIRNPAVLISSRVEDEMMKFIKFAKTPKQEDLIMWILSRCEFYSTQSYLSGSGKRERAPAELILGGKAAQVSAEENEALQEKLSTIKQTIIENRYPKTSAIAAANASKDSSHYKLPPPSTDDHHFLFDDLEAEEYQQRQSRGSRRGATGNRRSSSVGPVRTTTFDLKTHDKEIFNTNDDLGMYQLTRTLLGRSQTLEAMHKRSVKGREGAKQTIATQNFTDDHWRLCNEIARTRKEIASDLNQRRKLIEVAKTRQLQATSKFQTIKAKIRDEKGANQFVRQANNELTVLQQIQSNIQDDLKQQKIRIARGTKRVIWTMAPSGFANLRGKSQKGPVIGPGPLPPNATTDLKDPAVEMTVKKFYWDTAGRRHARKHGIDHDAQEESLLESAMEAIRKLAQNISAYKLDLKAVFEQFDTSGDGFLSPQEMAQAFLAMGVKLDIPTMQAIYDHFDPNHSGSVHYGEFVWAFFNRRKIVRQWKQKTKGLTLHQIQNTFHQYDINGNGSLSYREFAKLLKNVFHMQLSPQEINTLIDQFDVNQDGEIDIHEFLVFIQSEQKNFDESVNNPNLHPLAANRKAATSRPASAPRNRASNRPISTSSVNNKEKLFMKGHGRHHRTAPEALERHRIHQGRPGPPTILESEEEEEAEKETKNLNSERKRDEDQIEELKREIALSRQKLSQTDSQILMLKDQNREIKQNTEQEKENSPRSKTDQQTARIHRIINEAEKQSTHDSMQPQVDVVWVARMLQAQAEIENRLGRTYYKNNR